MIRSLSFTVPGPVKGQGRPRAYVRNGHAKTYNSEEDFVYRNKIQLIAIDAARKAGHRVSSIPPEKGYSVEITIQRGVPKSYSRKKTARALSGGILPKTKPDLDNVAKQVLDGMNGIVYQDDSAVTELSMRRVYGITDKLDVLITWEDEGGDDDAA